MELTQKHVWIVATAFIAAGLLIFYMAGGLDLFKSIVSATFQVKVGIK